MNKLNLKNFNLKTFTEQEVLYYCLLNNINPIDLSDNELTDISDIKLFINNNNIKNISVIQYLKNIKILENLESNQIQYINSLINLLYSYKGFKNMSVLNQL